MIVFSRNLILSSVSPESVDPNAPRIGYRSLALYGTIVADSQDIEHPITNVTDVATHTFWRSESLAEQYITINAGLNSGVDYIGFANHNLGSGGIAYRVEGSDNGVDWDVISDELIPGDDTPHVQLMELVTYAAYRVRLVPSSIRVPQIAVLYIGRMLAVQRNLYVGHTPITMGRNTNLVTNESENGQFLGRIIRSEYLTCTAAFQNLKPAWYRQQFEPFAKAARTVPFFWAWRPKAYPKEVGYCWLTEDAVPKNQRNNGMMQVALNMQGLGEYVTLNRDPDDIYEIST